MHRLTRAKRIFFFVVAFAGFLALAQISLEYLKVLLPNPMVSIVDWQVNLFKPIQESLLVLETFILCLIIESILFGWEQSSLKRLWELKTPSARQDLWFILLAQLRLTNVLSWVFTFGSYYLVNRWVGIHLSELNFYHRLENASPFLAIFSFLLLFTYLDYWNHRLLHSKLLWPLHRFHHSATELNLITTFRNHPAAILLEPLTRTLPFAVFGLPPNVAFYISAAVGFYSMILHVNEDLAWGEFGKYVLLSPLHHKIHHSAANEHQGSNYGIFAVWDRLHGTYYDDSLTRPLTLGVQDPNYSSSSNLLRIFVDDFKDFLRGLRLR